MSRGSSSYSCAGTGGTELEPEVVATLLVPVAGLRELAAHFTSSVEKIVARAKGADPSGIARIGDVDAALQNL